MSTIRIGPIEYEVTTGTDLSDGESLLSGFINYGDCEIKLLEGLPPQAARAVLIHEITHGILHQAGKTEHPEGFIEAISFGLLEKILCSTMRPRDVRT